MIRVVLDTNIVISALLTLHGLPAQLLLRCVTDPDLQLVVSADIYAEYEEVIRRPKFKRKDREIDSILRGIRASAIWIRPAARVRAFLDDYKGLFRPSRNCPKNDSLRLATVHDRNERSQGQGKPSECFRTKSPVWNPLRPIDALR